MKTKIWPFWSLNTGILGGLISGLVLVLILALTGFMLTGMTGCNYFSAAEQVLTGKDAVLTVELTGSTVDSIMQIAAKARHNGDLTAAQWNTLAALDAKFRPIYNAEVANIINKVSATPSTDLVALAKQIYATATGLGLKIPAVPALAPTPST